jgi:type III pantothenate kinase
VDTSVLTLDRGNTTLDVMLHGNRQRRQRWAVSDAVDLSAFLADVRPRCAVGVSVVPGGLLDAISQLQAMGLVVRMVGRDVSNPLRSDYETPQTLGPDRWLGALAAYHIFGRAITIDCGSATTVNLIEDDGVFRGGAIAPGLRAMIDGMAKITPFLPCARPALATPMPALSSASGVDTGVALAFCGAVERMVAELQVAARGNATLVLTGGHAEDYLRHGKLSPAHLPDLVHRGLLLLADR